MSATEWVKDKAGRSSVQRAIGKDDIMTTTEPEAAIMACVRGFYGAAQKDRSSLGLKFCDASEVTHRVVTSADQGIHLPPDKRRMGMVFRSYAIWPHMNVFENIAFPLRGQRLPPAEIRDKVMAMLQSLGLEGLHDRPAPLFREFVRAAFDRAREHSSEGEQPGVPEGEPSVSHQQ